MSRHMNGRRLPGIVQGETSHFINQHRVALFGHKHALAYRVVGQAFETLVAGFMEPQRQLFSITGIQAPGVVINLDFKQPMFTLVGNDVGIFANKLDRLGIAKADQLYTPQNSTIQGQFKKLGIFIGHGKQGLANGIEGQRRGIVFNPLDLHALQYDVVFAQFDRIWFDRLQQLADVKP